MVSDNVENDFEIGAMGASVDAPKLSFSMKTRDAFFARVSSQLNAQVSPEHGKFTARPMFNLMKVAFNNERVHYEVAFDVTRRILEIALHFEDGPVSTAAYLRYFDQRIVELKHLLGHEIELERWTLSWGRIFEIWPLESLERPIADRVAARLASYIAVLQPLVGAANVRPERSAEHIEYRHGPWRRHQRRSTA